MIERLVDHGCLDMTTQLRHIDESSKYSGRMSDVYQARLYNGNLVAVKCLRGLTSSENGPDKVLKVCICSFLSIVLFTISPSILAYSPRVVYMVYFSSS
jgi:hypothetical protein